MTLSQRITGESGSMTLHGTEMRKSNVPQPLRYRLAARVSVHPKCKEGARDRLSERAGERDGETARQQAETGREGRSSWSSVRAREARWPTYEASLGHKLVGLLDAVRHLERQE